MTNVVADQSAATINFDTGPVKHTVVTGTEVSREQVSIDTYGGLTPEGTGIGFASGAVGPVGVLNPPEYLGIFGQPDSDRNT